MQIHMSYDTLKDLYYLFVSVFNLEWGIILIFNYVNKNAAVLIKRH